MKVLRSLVWMLALSLALGLAIGTCVRRQAEAPARYIGSVEGQRPRPLQGTSATPARRFSTRAITNNRSESRFT